MNAHHQPVYAERIAPDTVRVERLLPASIDRVWNYLVQSDKRAEWLAAGAIEQRVGGVVSHVFRNSELTRNDDPAPARYAKEAGEVSMQGTVTACDPPRLLAYTWGADSEVRFDLVAEGQSTRLVVTHQRLGDRTSILRVSAGWHAHLGILADRLAGREPDGFWRTHTRLEAEYDRRFGEM